MNQHRLSVRTDIFIKNSTSSAIEKKNSTDRFGTKFKMVKESVNLDTDP